MSKKCHSCNGEVSETHTGKCPHCGEEKGYANTREINETVKISDFITAEKKAMKNALDDTYARYDELEKKFEDHYQALQNIKNKRKRLKEEEKELMKKAENNAKEDFEKSQKPKTFTKRSSIGAIIGTTEQKRIFELEKKLKAREAILDVLVRIQSDVSDIKEKLGLYDKFKEETIPKIRHNAIGPFQFLAISLIMSEGLLLYWMSEINTVLNAKPITVPISLLETIYYERIIAGSLSIAVLIAVLVVFSVVYRIKKKNKDFDN